MILLGRLLRGLSGGALHPMWHIYVTCSLMHLFTHLTVSYTKNRGLELPVFIDALTIPIPPMF